MRNWMRTATVVGGLCLAGAASAQVANTPEIEKKLREIGQTFTRETVGQTMALYKPLHAADLPAGITKLADQVYGPDERNRLDVYLPKGADGTQPIVTFAHGGGFVRGDKAEVANVCAWLASKGIVAVCWSYRFAPKAVYPSGVEDLNHVIDWIQKNPDLHKGDANHIVIAGNSAGAMHVLDWTLSGQDHAKSGVLGAIVISPPTVNLTQAPLDPQRDALYYGADPKALSERSIINRLDKSTLPMLIAYGEFDLAQVQDSVRQLANGLYKRDGHMPLLEAVPGHTHISIVEHFGTDDTAFGDDLVGYVHLLSLRAGQAK
ncbi:MAG TPA: alpha/beta hydrolase [Ensifer sp.]|nr:alpha/beta hydrolase [Ensifer sp.]